MLILLPILLLIITAVTIQLLSMQKSHIGILWLLAVVGSIGALISILLWKWIEPEPIVFTMLHFDLFEGVPIVFQNDHYSWPYALAIGSLLAAVVFTSSESINEDLNPTIWSSALLLSAVCIAVITSATPLALIIAWIILDLIELLIIIQTIKVNVRIQRVIIFYSFKTLGTFILLFTLLLNDINVSDLGFVELTQNFGIVAILSICLRLGVIPVYVPYLGNLGLQRGLRTLIRIGVPAANMVILARMSESAIPPNYAPGLLLFASLAAFFGSVIWLISNDEIQGQSFWAIAFSGITIACAVRGKPISSIPWGVAMILCGGLLSLYSIRNKIIAVLVVGGLISLSGIPFSLTASGWDGLIIAPFNMMDIIVLASISLLISGYIRFLFTQGETFAKKENWVKITYTFGLLIIIGSIIIESFYGWPDSLNAGMFWPGALSLLIAVLILLSVVIYKKFVPENITNVLLDNRILKNSKFILKRFFELEWLFLLIGYIYGLIQRMILFLTKILEGDGGVIWSFLFLILIITIISSRFIT